MDSPTSARGHAALDVSVVICTYADVRFAGLRRAVISAVDQSPPPREVIVVVDHNDALMERVRREIPGVAVVANAGPRGLSGARNSGVAAAVGGVVAFLDDDAAALPGWLAALCEPYRVDSVLGTGGAAEPEWQAGRPRWFPPEFDWVVGCSYVGLPLASAPVRNPLGCSMSFRREVFATVGGFRADVGRVGTRPFGCEETELSIRASRHWPGHTIVYAPASRVQHSVPASRSTWGYFVARCFDEGRSKSTVTRATGGRAGLSSEAAYVKRVLPSGVAASLAATLRLRDRYGLLRAAAIIVGLLVTSTGYVMAGLGAWLAGALSAPEALPPADR
jgi:glucosyl-dolichyl phosphate glucuronosyltransferase